MLTMAFNTPGWTGTPVRFTLPPNLQSSRDSSSHPAWNAKVWRATICVPATDTGSEPAARTEHITAQGAEEACLFRGPS